MLIWCQYMLLVQVVQYMFWQTVCLYIRPAVCIASVSLCIRPDLVWYFTYLSNYYITVSGWRQRRPTAATSDMLLKNRSLAATHTSHYRQGAPAEGHPQSASYTVNERQHDVSSVLSEHAASNPDDHVNVNQSMSIINLYSASPRKPLICWILRMLITGYLDTRVPCGLPRSRETSDLPSYRDRLHQSTDCRVATYRLNCWLQQKAWSIPCVGLEPRSLDAVIDDPWRHQLVIAITSAIWRI